MSEAFEVLDGVAPGSPFVFVCEHATHLLPEWEPTPNDRPWLEEHWGWDIGAADLTRALAAETGAPAVLSRFSRLVCDPNRDPSQASFVVRRVEGHDLSFNRSVDEAERKRRQERYFDPYHDAVDRVLARRLREGGPVELCSVHSFTRDGIGARRSMEIGVLFDTYEDRARRLADALADVGFAVALNEPYSGLEGLIYAARRHGRAHGVVYLEIEVGQDLIDAPGRARSVGERVAKALAAYAAPAPSGDEGATT